MMTFIEEVNLVERLASEVKHHGGEAYFVGGYVRDEIMGTHCKDIDVEVHGISCARFEEILDKFGQRIETGKSFGVYKISHCSVDFALPRAEENTGRGHRDFKIFTDPYAGTKNAARRRDFTINSIMKNVLTGELTDHFGGLEDIKNGCIRHIDDDSFKEDPLRVLRAAQFAARFDFVIDSRTMELCSGMSLDTLSNERVFMEMEKALLKSDTPSVFFENIRQMNHLSYWFPELEALIGIEQNKTHHKEGDVWTHTMMVLDCAAKYRDKVQKPLSFMLSALVHDFGKAMTTSKKNGVIHSYNHETEGLPVVREFVKRLTNNNEITRYVLNMTEHHMKPNMLYAHKSAVKATNKMFDKSVAPGDLIYLAMCDSLGKLPKGDTGGAKEFLEKRYNIYNEYMSRPYVTGKDLLDAGIKEGKNYRELLNYAHKLRLAGIKKEDALKQTISYSEEL
jgi:tRNA nucleotidyltransferase (CCA-adding enzyme)